MAFSRSSRVLWLGVLLGCVDPEVQPSPTRSPLEDPDARITDSNTIDDPGAISTSWPALDPDDHARLWSSPEDPPTMSLAGATGDLVGQHYLTGNEHHLDAFADRLGETRGGGYIGVGADQAFLLIAWADPELAWLIDYDAEVVAIHRIHLTFLRAADTPDQFFELWSREGRTRAHALLQADPDALALYRANLRVIHNRLEALRSAPDRTGTANYLTDADLYQRIHALALADRIRPMVGDLLGCVGLQGIAEAARELDVPIRVLYLSNAEEYWPDYGEQFRANVAALPWRDDAVILRTLLTWSRNRDYAYNLQSATNFQAWLSRPWVHFVYQVVHRPVAPTLAPGEVDVFETTRDPSESPAERRWLLQRSAKPEHEHDQ
jgi:hypothetical protein